MKKILLASVFMITGCNLANDIVNTSKDIKGESQHLSKRTEDLEAELSLNASSDMQDKKLAELFDNGPYQDLKDANGRPVRNVSEPDLIVTAGYVIQSMLFQYWKGDYTDGLAQLDSDFAQSLEILFGRLTIHLHHPYTVDQSIRFCWECDMPFAGPDRDYTAIGALSVKLDLLWSRYEDTLAKNKLPRLSVYEVLVRALSTRGQVDRHDELLPETMKMVLQWRDEAIFLMQMRHNFLPLMVLARMTDFQDANFLGNRDITRVNEIIFGKSVDLNYFDPEQLRLWTGYLNDALAARQALADMCIEPQYNTMMNLILQRLDYGQGALLAKPLNKLTPFERVKYDFANALNKIAGKQMDLKSKKMCPPTI